MMPNEKPPLGVSPWWFVYPKRVIELSEAISRYTEYSLKHTLTRKTKEDYKLIHQWATEIEKMAETIIHMQEDIQDGK